MRMTAVCETVGIGNSSAARKGVRNSDGIAGRDRYQLGN